MRLSCIQMQAEQGDWCGNAYNKGICWYRLLTFTWKQEMALLSSLVYCSHHTDSNCSLVSFSFTHFSNTEIHLEVFRTKDLGSHDTMYTYIHTYICISGVWGVEFKLHALVNRGTREDEGLILPFLRLIRLIMFSAWLVGGGSGRAQK